MSEALAEDTKPVEEDREILKKDLARQIRIRYWKNNAIELHPSCPIDDMLKDMTVEDLEKILEKEIFTEISNVDSKFYKNKLSIIGKSLDYLLSCEGIADMLTRDSGLVDLMAEQFAPLIDFVPIYVKIILRVWDLFLSSEIKKKDESDNEEEATPESECSEETNKTSI